VEIMAAVLVTWIGVSIPLALVTGAVLRRHTVVLAGATVEQKQAA
jgi:hypothetical protein